MKGPKQLKDKQIAYKPLSTSATQIILKDGAEMEDEEEEGEDYDGDRLSSPFVVEKIAMMTNESSCGPRIFVSLRQLRLLLFGVASILFLIFLLSLTSNSSNPKESHHHHPSAAYLKSASPLYDQINIAHDTYQIGGQRTDINDNKTVPRSLNNRPKYDNYLLSIVHDREKGSSLEEGPIDDLQYPEIDHLKQYKNDNNNNNSLVANNVWWTNGIRNASDGKYITVTNYIRAMKSFNFNSSITLTTQATTEFMYHTLELCKRWDGPISVAVFAPGAELRVALTLIKFLRLCLSAPLSACIRDKVTWHIAYNEIHKLSGNNLSFPREYLDSTHYTSFVQQDQCPKLAGPEAIDLIKQFELELKRKNDLWPRSYRQQFQLTYPINILRNLARQGATTRHILASDIELYPSVNLVPYFINFITKHDIAQEYPKVNKHVFALPIFEVSSNVSAPKTKSELVELFKNGQAIFFHKYVCDACQNFPHRLDWLTTDKYGEDNYHASNLSSSSLSSSGGDGELVIFLTTQRNSSRNSWEPIFIGTNEDPFYDDRLTWEGRRDKMGQMYEMCLQDYHLFVLGNAFLIHAPGIKHFDKNDFTRRLKYIRDNNSIYDTTIVKLKKQYENSANIHKC